MPAITVQPAMPLIPRSSYIPPFWCRNRHLQTIIPALFRHVSWLTYRRERLELDDGDFLDLDWSQTGSDHLAIIGHGLEGNSHRTYVRGMARAANLQGWDALAWNFRGCGGEMNRLPRLYHNGDWDDLAAVVDHALEQDRYAAVALIGCSMGGNVTLNYLGSHHNIPPQVVGAVAISVPCDLASTARQLAKPHNRIYMRYFLRSLHDKVRRKQEQFPEHISDAGYKDIKDFETFDDRYTAPLHGFDSAKDYWAQTSCLPRLPRIAVPTLMISADDDPFLAPESFPSGIAAASKTIHLETPQHGGHMGFVTVSRKRLYWTEQRAFAFLHDLTVHH